MTQSADKENFDELAEPQHADMPREHALWPKALAALKEVYDPEIPVNVYELGLIYKVTLAESTESGKFDADVKMTLTSPGCPVAQEMPGWIQGALFTLEEIHNVDVEIIWDPPWSPAMMAETAKMQLNMFM